MGLIRAEPFKNDYHNCRTAGPDYIISTSSTAQGGGGSFKNRKPIGEIGCCESGMAERSTDGPKGA